MQNLAETVQKIIITVLRKVINLCIFYMLDLCSRDLNPDFTFGNCLFGVMNLTKNYDPDKFGYRGYGMHVHNSHYLMVAGAKMSLFSELTIVLLCMLIIKRTIS